MTEQQQILQGMETAIRNAGEMVRQAGDIAAKTEEKGDVRNLVTEYDRRVQGMLYADLTRVCSDASFLGEEAEEHFFASEGRQFIIDPIDGTANFVHGLGLSAISVALFQNGKAEIAAVYQPFTDEMYTAIRGGGAFCNGRALHVSDRLLREGLVLFGSAPYYAELYDQTFQTLRTLFDAGNDIRRLGSAAIDLCLVAAGKGDAFFEWRLQPWDHAAGALILQEAGGIVTQMNGKPLRYDEGCSVLAGNPNIYNEALQLINK